MANGKFKQALRDFRLVSADLNGRMQLLGAQLPCSCGLLECDYCGCTELGSSLRTDGCEHGGAQLMCAYTFGVGGSS